MMTASDNGAGAPSRYSRGDAEGTGPLFSAPVAGGAPRAGPLRARHRPAWRCSSGGARGRDPPRTAPHPPPAAALGRAGPPPPLPHMVRSLRGRAGSARRGRAPRGGGSVRMPAARPAIGPRRPPRPRPGPGTWQPDGRRGPAASPGQPPSADPVPPPGSPAAAAAGPAPLVAHDSGQGRCERGSAPRPAPAAAEDEATRPEHPGAPPGSGGE